MKKRLPRVVLCGRVNAGKSTLFNKLSDTSQAIVSADPGTTRDLNFSDITWYQKTFSLIDTGGFDAGQLGAVEKYVQRKAEEAVQKADLVLLVVDGRLANFAKEREMIRRLRKMKKKVILVINKVDSQNIQNQLSPTIYKLGLSQNIIVSSITGRGTGDLLDMIIKEIPHREKSLPADELRLSIIGKTNVGKSSLVNAILGLERMIVTPLPHTTREPQDIHLQWEGKNFVLVDTAGLRKNSKKAGKIEKISVQRTLAAIKHSQVCLFVVDVHEPLSSQDQAIGSLACQYHNGVIIVANKWDLIANKDQSAQNAFALTFHRYFPHLWWAPLVFVSAKEKQRTAKLLQIAHEIQKQSQRWLTPEELKSFFLSLLPKKGRLNKGKQKALRSLYQTGANPPTFALRLAYKNAMHPAFLNLMEKKMRQRFGFNGTPLVFNMK